MPLSSQGGFIVVDKPVGPTSFDVVAMVRRALKVRAVGHAGTLDPFATGVLVVLVGEATRLADCVGAGSKGYRATALLGVETTTDDLTGEVVSSSDATVDDAALMQALMGLVGAQLQVPPAFSAKHVDGQRAYDLARAGQKVELKPSLVDIQSVTLVERDGNRVVFDVECGKGTYIRAMARDLGRALGVGAHLVALRRTHIGALGEQLAVPPSALGPEVVGTAHALSQLLPHVTVDVAALPKLLQGGAFQGGVVGSLPWTAGGMGVVVCGERLVAVAKAPGALQPGTVVTGAQVELGRRFPTVDAGSGSVSE